MVAHQPDQSAPLIGLLAEFRSQEQLVIATRELRQLGYGKLDVFSPFPIHGLDEILGLRRSRLPWLVLISGVVGGVSALAFQWWTNAKDYPFLISGKPLFSLPANIPITFEVIILAAALAAFTGMLLFNGLPRLANPLLRNERFRRVSNSGFFLMIYANDPLFALDATAALLRRFQAVEVEAIPEPIESPQLPRPILMAAVILGAVALLPPLLVAVARSTTSDKPRLHNFFDMDFQPKLKPQTTSTLFADGRAMRPRVPGTIPRGQLQADKGYYQGSQPVEHATDGGSADSAVGVDQETNRPAWIAEFPVPVTRALMQRGRERYNIHCAVCHGRAGEGNGLASLRALELEQGTWVPPTSVHADHVRQQAVGELFHTITNGVRKMPAYGQQISPEDRWAIVLYLRALQRSQNATLEDVPAEVRPTLRELN